VRERERERERERKREREREREKESIICEFDKMIKRLMVGQKPPVVTTMYYLPLPLAPTQTVSVILASWIISSFFDTENIVAAVVLERSVLR
jgi:hypothetical protein